MSNAWFQRDYVVTALTADPFTDTATLDFTPNNVAGAGAVLRGAEYPLIGVVDPGSDLGALQRHPAAGGGGGCPLIGPGGLVH